MTRYRSIGAAMRAFSAPVKALDKYRNAKLKGQVSYRDHTVRIPAEAVDDKFIQNLN